MEKKAHKANSSNPLRVVNSDPPNLWRFLTRQTEGKLLQSEDIKVPIPSALPGDLSHSEQEFALPEGLCTQWSSSLHEKYPLNSTYNHLIISSLKNMSLPNGNCARGTYICWRKNTKQQTPSGCFFLSVFSSLSKSELCVCVSFSQTASKYMRSALGLCLALARLGQPHSKFPEGEQREKRFHADKSLAQIKRQISGKDKRC